MANVPVSPLAWKGSAVLIMAARIEHFFIRGLRFRCTRQRLDKVLLDLGELDRLFSDLARRDHGILVIVPVSR
jgi:hypothetical protein